jgi:hypothetical protein
MNLPWHVPEEVSEQRRPGGAANGEEMPIVPPCQPLNASDSAPIGHTVEGGLASLQNRCELRLHGVQFTTVQAV